MRLEGWATCLVVAHPSRRALRALLRVRRFCRNGTRFSNRSVAVATGESKAKASHSHLSVAIRSVVRIHDEIHGRFTTDQLLSCSSEAGVGGVVVKTAGGVTTGRPAATGT